MDSMTILAYIVALVNAALIMATIIGYYNTDDRKPKILAMALTPMALGIVLALLVINGK